MKIAKLIILLFCCLVYTQSAIRGVWMTISGTSDPFTVQGIMNVVFKCADIGINTIYFSVWDQSMVNFFPDAQLFTKYSFLKTNPHFNIDPLQTLIRYAQPLNIKVVAWFQYGFAVSYNNPSGGPILIENPDWKSFDKNGKLTEKNKFQWMNAFHPEVQSFMIDIIESVAKKYSINGIQGDDRLPAMPSNSGYDPYTLELYKKQHGGKQPPVDQKDEQWVNWRCELLNKFLSHLYSRIKSIKQSLQIYMAPSVYPWSKYQYLQDWPTWVTRNLTDIISPQIYRYSINAYEQTLKSNIGYIESQKMSQFYPGVLIGVGGNPIANVGILEQMLKINRQNNIGGEIFFYHESIKDKSVQQFIKKSYRTDYDQSKQ